LPNLRTRTHGTPLPEQVFTYKRSDGRRPRPEIAKTSAFQPYGHLPALQNWRVQ